MRLSSDRSVRPQLSTLADQGVSEVIVDWVRGMTPAPARQLPQEQPVEVDVRPGDPYLCWRTAFPERSQRQLHTAGVSLVLPIGLGDGKIHA